MTTKLVSYFILFIALSSFACTYLLASPAHLNLSFENSKTVENLLVLIIVGTITGLGFLLAARNKIATKSKTIVIACTIPILLLLPGILQTITDSTNIPSQFITALVAIAFYYAILAIKLKKTTIGIIAACLFITFGAELFLINNIHSPLNPLTSTLLAYRITIIGTFAIYLLNTYIRSNSTASVLSLLTGGTILFTLTQLNSLIATSAFLSALLLTIIGQLSTNLNKSYCKISTYILLIIWGFYLISINTHVENIAPKLLAFSFNSLFDGNCLGHGYNTFPQAAFIHGFTNPNTYSLLVTTIYEAGISGIFALAIALWLMLRNSLKYGCGVLTSLSRTANIVPIIIAIIYAPNITQYNVLLFSIIAICAILERTSSPQIQHHPKNQFLNYQFSWFIPGCLLTYCITGLLSLPCVEQKIATYHLKSINTSYSIYNKKLGNFPNELIPLFSVKSFHGTDKTSNYKRIFKIQENTPTNFIDGDSNIANYINRYVNKITITNESMLYNPFPNIERLSEAEAKFGALVATDSHMPLLGLEAYENITNKLKTSLDPDLMFASAVLCKTLAQNNINTNISAILGYMPDFETCYNEGLSKQRELQKSKPFGIETFTSHVLKHGPLITTP